MILIYISGIDGCGKTTQAKRLVEWMNERGFDAAYQWLRWEPSIVSLIKTARRAFSGKPAGSANAKSAEDAAYGKWTGFKRALFSLPAFRRLWLAYATRDYLRAYRRAVANWRSDCIVLDRYLFDFVVDQSVNLDMTALDFEEYARKSPLRQMPRPNLSVFIHLPPETAHARKSDGTPLPYLEKRVSRYNELPSSERTLHLDGTRPVEVIHEEIARWVSERLPKGKR